MNIQTAASMKVKRLYRYQRFAPDRLGNLLQTNTVYCTSPNNFNDPWDCRPCFNDGQLENPEVLEKHIRWFEQADRKHYPKTDHQHRQMAESLRRNPHRVREMVNEVSCGIGSVIDQRYGVCCFTTKADSTLMWSHYADHHKGICLEFGADNHVVSAALKVEYRAEYPFLDLSDNGAEHNLLPLISKSSEWAYEDEYRLVAQERKVALGNGSLMMDDHLLELALRTIKSVIVGCSMPDHTLKELSEIVAQTGDNVKIKRAIRIRDHYRVKIEPGD
jgi:hypothetical protein